MKHRNGALSIILSLLWFALILTLHMYLSEALCMVLVQLGTVAQFSCLVTLARNRVVERKHCHILEITHALMIAFPVLGMRSEGRKEIPNEASPRTLNLC
jgi:hypothetical protein